MASGSQNNTSFQVQKWTNTRAFTIGETSRDVDGTSALEWTKDNILGASDSTKFLRGDKAWSNTLEGAFWIKYNTPNFYIKDTSTADDTYAIIRFGNSSNDNGAYIFLNGPNRTGDGGKNMMTIRNNVGDLRLNNNTEITGTLYLTRTTDAEGTADNKPALIIGTLSGVHLEFDGNEIMAKATATTTSTLYINNNGGTVSSGGTFYSSASPGFNNTVSAGSWSYLRLHNGSHTWDIATKSNSNDGALDFRPGGGDTGPYISRSGHIFIRYKSGSWVNSLTNSAITIPDQSGSYGGWICGPTNEGRIAISTYQANDNKIYLGYGERERTTNSFAQSINWDGKNNILSCARVDMNWLRVVHNSSNNSDDAVIYLENKNNNDWAMKINCTGYDYGLQITCKTDSTNALSITGRQVIDGKIYISQPSARRDNGIVGTYDSTKAAAIWSMGSSYQINAAGTSLSSLYGAAYAHTNATSALGSQSFAGGHQFLWCQNGTVYVALGNNLWVRNTVTAGAFSGPLTGNVTGNCSGSSGSCTGNAATATRINGTLGNATSSVAHNIWVSSTNSADGIPNYVSSFYMNPSTKEFGVPSGTRIYPQTGALYLGNSGNQSWVYVQDMASQASGTPWKLTQAGVLTCVTVNANLTGNVTGNCSGSSGSCTGIAERANYINWVASNEIRFAWESRYGSATDLYFGYAFSGGNKSALINNYRFCNGNTALTGLYAAKVYNAVWNDFAEYRESDITEGGRVLVSDGKGRMILSTERLQPSARVISDTFGCSVGQSDTAHTPIGVAGRVLVYPYQSRENYKVGDCLCAAPGGTADIMSREEIKEYPDRIIGIVDEVPEYEIWDQVLTTKKDDDETGGQNHTNIEVKGRIWIYVR